MKRHFRGVHAMRMLYKSLLDCMTSDWICRWWRKIRKFVFWCMREYFRMEICIHVTLSLSLSHIVVCERVKVNEPLSVCVCACDACKCVLYCTQSPKMPASGAEGSIDKMKAKETEANKPTTPPFIHSFTYSLIRTARPTDRSPTRFFTYT